MRNAKLPAGLIRQLDDAQDAVFFDPAAGLCQRDMRRNMDNAQIVMRQHHGVFLRVGVGRVNLGVTVKMVPRQIHRFLVERRRDCRVRLAVHRKLNDLDHGLKRGIARHGGNFAVFQLGHIHIVHVDDINAAILEARFRGPIYLVERQLAVRDPQSILHHAVIRRNNRAALVIDFGL